MLNTINSDFRISRVFGILFVQNPNHDVLAVGLSSMLLRTLCLHTLTFAKLIFMLRTARMSSASASSPSSSSSVAIHWFRKGLRLHDNPALVEACNGKNKVYPVFVIDPFYAKPDVVGYNRYAFLLDSLTDLDTNLRAMGSRLFVVRGKPEEQLPLLVAQWGVSLLTFESDSEPYACVRDKAVREHFERDGKLSVSAHCSHTLRDPTQYIAAAKSKPIKSYQGFQALFESADAPPLRTLSPTITRDHICPSPHLSVLADHNEAEHGVPTFAEMGYGSSEKSVNRKFPGGEREGLRRLRETVLARAEWVATFEKPQTSPNSLEPSTTVLSPYLKFGCVSPLLFYSELQKMGAAGPKHTKPPVSLTGQLLWREYFYYSSVAQPNFHTMKGNPECRQIPWSHNEEYVKAFKEARTGFPYIDAIMTQLRQEGWIHHLARHSVACFFTRGDLWQSWEEGAKIFDLYLLDADYALNNANWQWLSCSNFFYQYFRVYSPIAFGKKTDPNGAYIKKWLPQLAGYPKEFIYEPWRCPIEKQQRLGCVVGVDYPKPIVDHDVVSKENMQRMAAAYAASAPAAKRPPPYEADAGNRPEDASKKKKSK